MFIGAAKKYKKISFIAIFAFILLCLFFATSVTNAATDPGQAQSGGTPTATNEDGTTCAVEKIGWFVCPIVESSAKIGDNMFSFLADNFLQTEPALISSGDGNGTKTAWELARNTANILFIIVFIIVIYSQVTSTGLSNYGIKRMMPRLIIVAIAMNLSYLICQLVVDLTNTLGYAIMDWLVSLSHTVFSQSIMPVQTPGTNNVTDVSLLGTMATVAIASAVVWMLIGPLIGTIGLIVATCIAVVVILLLRKTFIILLVVVSPLAFVAYLLPNTEKLFSKWLNMFWKLLLVFPIVAMLMGGGQLASAIILASGHSAGYGENAAYKAKGEPCVYLDPAMKDEKCEDGEGPGIMLALVAAGVAVAPLLAVFAVMKGALAAAGAIGGKIAQGIQRGSGGVGKSAQGKLENSALARGMAARKVGKQQFKDNRYAQGVVGNDKSFRGRARKAMSGGITGVLPKTLQTDSIQAQQSAVKRQAVNVASSNLNQQTQDAEAEYRLTSRGDFGAVAKYLQDAIAQGNEVGARAAQNILMTGGGSGMDAFAAAIEHSDEVNSAHIIAALKQNALEKHTGAMKDKAGHVNSWAGGQSTMSENRQGVTRDGRAINPMGGLSDSQIAKQTTYSLTNAVSRGQIDHNDASRILSSTASEDMGREQRQILTTLSARGPQPTPPPQPTMPTPRPTQQP